MKKSLGSNFSMQVYRNLQNMHVYYKVILLKVYILAQGHELFTTQCSAMKLVPEEQIPQMCFDFL